MKQLLESNGFTFSHNCTICTNDYDVYKNASKPGVEVMLAHGKDYFKVYMNKKQIGYGKSFQLESKLQSL